MKEHREPGFVQREEHASSANTNTAIDDQEDPNHSFYVLSSPLRAKFSSKSKETMPSGFGYSILLQSLAVSVVVVTCINTLTDKEPLLALCTRLRTVQGSLIETRPQDHAVHKTASAQEAAGSEVVKACHAKSGKLQSEA